MAAELPRPGVEIIQEFRAVTPTILTPTLVPCVVGVGKQIVDLLVDNGSGSSVLNTDALVSLQGFFVSADGVGATPIYGGLDGLALIVAINNGPDITITFSDPTAVGLTPATIVSQIQAAFTLAGVTAALPSLVGTDTWKLSTVGVGEFQFIDIRTGTAAAVASAFGIGIGRRYAGLTSYNQRIVDVLQISFPDPRGNLEELLIEADTVRVFLGTGNGGFRESLRDSAFLRGGIINDPVIVTGTADIDETFAAALYGGGGTLDTTTLVVKVDGGVAQTVTFAVPADDDAVAAQIVAQTTGLDAAATGVASPSNIRLTTLSTGASASLEIVSGTALAILGLTAGPAVVSFSVEAVDDGNGDHLTSLVRLEGENFITAATAAAITGAAGTFPLVTGGTLVINGGDQSQEITLDPADSLAVVVTKINDVVGTLVGGKLTASDDGGELKFLHSETGTDSLINIVGGSAVTELGHSVGITYAADLSLPNPGDELWIDGAFIAEVSEVAPGAAVDQVRVAAQLTIGLNIGTTFFFIAKNLPGVAGRPRPDLIVDGNGDLQIKQEQLRDVSGGPVATSGLVYVSYTAVRLDVTPRAAQPGLLRFDDTSQVEDTLSPINAENPLALGLFFALINAPGIQVTGIGVDSVSADSPFGTVEGFTRAAEFLEGVEVYSIAPMTHDQTVGQVFSTHVSAMSAPDAKGERVALINPEIPENRVDTLVASGTDGSTTGAGGTSFDTGIANLTGLIQAAGISPIGTIPTTEGLFLDIGSDAKSYSIASVTGSVVVIRKVFAPGENDDSFYSVTDLNDPPLPAALVDEAFSIKIRGASLATAVGPDLNGIAETIAAIGQGFLNRRLWMTVPDACAATIEGSEQLIDGFYIAAALAGMVGQNPPQQSFTNFPISGFTRTIGSNDTFNDRQLNVMAAGGAWVIIQESQGAPLTSRMALTTDLTSIETRTDSITKVVDFTAKFMRNSLKNFIGRFNITQGFLDTLGGVVQGVIGFLVESGVLIGGNLNNIIQDEDAPDTVLIDVTLDVPFPANYIRLTLVI